MSNQTSQTLHIFFFPFMAHGHIIPAIDMAKLFASRGCRSSIVLTPANATLFARSIQKSLNLGLEINIVLIKFPTIEAGLPEGCENFELATKGEMIPQFFMATTMLEQPLQELIAQHSPDCLVADIFYPWATELAAKFEIPRLVFHGTSFFALCASICLTKYRPHSKVSSETERFVIPNLPDEVKITSAQLPPYMKEESEMTIFASKAEETELTSFGVIMNSYYELEPAYADYYRRVHGRKAWHIGPVSLYNKEKEEKVRRGPKPSVGEYEILNWLNSKKPNSVLYVGFGSAANFNDTQLLEIAIGLEASGQQFIWVVKREKREGVNEEWLPQGFEKRMEGRGLMIRGWAPQVIILEHKAVGGFVTHCGWNSILEGVCAGLPMVAWPVSAEQFYNEKFVTKVLGIGIGIEKWASPVGDLVKKEAIEKAVSRIMDGEEAEEMRSRAIVLGEMARRAFKEGGSSYSDLNILIEELRLYRAA